MKPISKKIFKIIVIIILAEALFFGGMVFQELRTEKQETIVYTTQEKTITEHVYNELDFEELERKITRVKGIGMGPDEETGRLLNFTIATTPGNGKILIDTSERTYDSIFQSSIRNVKDAVEETTEQNLDSINVKISSSGVGSVKGSSASIAIGVGLKSIVTEQEIEKDKALTGVIRPKGSIAQVGLLNEKIKVAEEAGMEQILIPAGQCEEYERPVNIEVACVNNLEEAFNVMKK